MKTSLTMAAIALAAYAYLSETEYPDCYTDTCVLEQCSKDLGRPCTDEDIFGPVNPTDCRPDETLPPCDRFTLKQA